MNWTAYLQEWWSIYTSSDVTKLKQTPNKLITSHASNLS